MAWARHAQRLRGCVLPASPRRRLLVLFGALLCCASATATREVVKTGHKSHRGKHEAASRRQRKAAFGESLLQATGGMCHYLEDSPFQDFFDEPLNTSRWDERSLDGLFHCNRGTDEYVRAPRAAPAHPVAQAQLAARKRASHAAAAAGSFLEGTASAK